MLAITSFQVEHLEQGCVTDREKPVFSWYGESDRPDNEIRDAVLQVGDWKKRSKKQCGLRYQGKPLKPMRTYEASLRLVDAYGETAEQTLSFETGRMGKPFEASWITDGAYEFREKKVSPKPLYFVKELQIERPEEIAAARVYVTALGLYELSLNGKKVGEDLLTPGFTSYRNEMQYQVYDITEQLSSSGGEVRAEATVTGGWAVGSYTYYRRNRVYGKRQALLAEIRVRYTDGAEAVYGTDESWLVTADGALKEADIYDGEVFDGSLDPAGLQMHQASAVTPKALHFTEEPNLIASYGAPVRAHEVMRPVSVITAPSGERIYDFGQNFTGVVHLKLNGKRGQEVTVRHAEVLMDGELCYTPLRSAKQRLLYICRDGEQEYEPRFTYMGFRYVGVRGIAEEDLTIWARAIYSDVKDSGSFSSSDEMLNRLQSAIRWGAKSNFTDIPTDCPQRDERLGWTGDIALFSPTACFNFDMSRFLEKWLLDVKSEQGPGGGIPMIVPSVKIYNQVEMTLTMAVDHWGDCCIWVPWAEYLARGNVRILWEMYPTMRRYMAACERWAKIGSFGSRKRIWSLGHHYGDWCAPDTEFRGWMKRGKYTATACLARSAAIMARIAAILGHTDHEQYYTNLMRETAKAYREVLMDADMRAKDEFQTAYVLPLYYGLLEGEEQKKAAAHLVELVRKNDWHIGTGFPGTPYILFALADNGYVDDAYRMLLTDTCPSWLYEIRTGGTTTWERWDALREDGSLNTGGENGSGGMVSFNHYAAGAVGDFFYRRIAGIEAKEAGYRRFLVQPVPGGGLTWAEASYISAYGEIFVRWDLDPETKEFRLKVKVPFGSLCEVILPDGQRREFGSGIHEAGCVIPAP